MRLLVDADSLASRLRTIIVRAADRYSIAAIFVANKRLDLPKSVLATMTVAPDADEWIVENALEGDLAVTRDIPLAARLARLGVTSISDRGEILDETNASARLSERDFAMSLRESGMVANQPRPYAARDQAAFANALDRELVRRAGNPDARG